MKAIMKKSLLLGLICLMFLPATIVYAHGMHLILEEPGLLKVEYDGGGFSSRTEVILYDEDGQELEKGPVDDEGKYHFDKSLDVDKAIADDGMGHRAEYKKGVEEKNLPKLPIVIGVFAVVGLIFLIYNKKSKKKQVS